MVGWILRDAQISRRCASFQWEGGTSGMPGKWKFAGHPTIAVAGGFADGPYKLLTSPAGTRKAF